MVQRHHGTAALSNFDNLEPKRDRGVEVVGEDDVRRVALSLPATSERSSYGTPGFRVRDRLFARIRPEGDSVVVWCADIGEKEAIIAAEPDKFFTMPHYDGHPTVLLAMGGVGLDDLTEALTQSWRLRAPSRLLAEFDRGA